VRPENPGQGLMLLLSQYRFAVPLWLLLPIAEKLFRWLHNLESQARGYEPGRCMPKGEKAILKTTR